MTKIELLVVIVLAALACASETEEGEKNKRGAGKTTSLNAIPTGAQKPDYTYSIYSQNPSSQSSQSGSYQAHVPNSFYPSQGSQYSAPSYTQAEASHYQQQPQINFIPPTTSSQFVPINFIPNPGYQTKYQLVPTKSSNGNIQLAFLQQPAGYQTPILQYPQGLISPNPTSQFHPQHSQLFSTNSPQGHFNVPNYQPFSLGNSYLGQPSMLLLPQPSASLYNNLYPNPLQSLYNYFPSNNPSKYGSYVSTPQTTEYEKIQTPQQGISKEDNDISVQSSEYVSASDSAYKNPYTASRSSAYTKLK